MSSKTKSITQLVEDLQKENERLKTLQKLFNRACKEEFGFDVKTIHHKLELAALYEKQSKEKKEVTHPRMVEVYNAELDEK